MSTPYTHTITIITLPIHTRPYHPPRKDIKRDNAHNSSIKRKKKKKKEGERGTQPSSAR